MSPPLDLLSRRKSLGILAAGALGTIDGASSAKFAQSRKPERTIRFCSQASSDMPWTAVGVVFGDELFRLTEGRLGVEVYPNAMLAGGALAIDLLRVGAVEMYVEAPTILAAWHSDIGIFDHPYLFSTLEESNCFFDGEWSSGLLEEFRNATKMRVLGGLNHGFRHVVSAKPIRSMADLRNLKIRVGPAPSTVRYWKALGANPIPMEFSELYTSLATGIVDALEQPYFVLELAHFYEVTEFINLTSHQATFALWVLSDEFYRAQSPDDQQAIKQAMTHAVEWGRRQVALEEAGRLSNLLKKGMSLIETDTQGMTEIANELLPINAEDMQHNVRRCRTQKTSSFVDG